MKSYFLPVSILIMGLLYIFIIPNEPFSIKLFFKLIPMILIIYYGFLQSPQKKETTHRVMLTGLIFCIIGDGTLHWFTFGLIAFLIGHIFYIAGFVTQFKFSWLRFSIIIPLILYGIFFTYRLGKNLITSGNGSLIIPAIFYIVAILLMALFATLTENNWVLLGSLLFIISDSILAWNKFIEPIPFSGPLIMITYYSAQFFIAYSLKTIIRKRYRVKDKPGMENIYYII